MKKNFSKIFALICLCGVSLVSFSCATKVYTTVRRPAEFNLQGAISIAVLPFQLSNTVNYESSGFLVLDVLDFFLSSALNTGNTDESRAANYITSNLTSRVSASGYYTLVSSSAVQNALKNGTTAPCDAYLTGQILDFNYNTESHDYKKKIDDETYETVTEYRRNVTVRVLYQVIDSKTNRILESRSRKYTNYSSYYPTRLSMPSAYEIIENDLDSLVKQIMKELEPYDEQIELKLMSDKSKNHDMELAKKYVENNLIEKALDKYQEVYTETGMFEAGYNAAILYEAYDNLQTAKTIMTRLVDATGDKKAVSALANINYEIQQEEKLHQQTEARNVR